MIVGTMQPYFFPYLGYFQLMKHVDIWVILDKVQFVNRGWVNRNRILHPDVRKEWNFITVPLSKRGQFDRICDISIAEAQDWRDRLFNKLFVYREAPYYEETAGFVEQCLACPEENLAVFLKETLASTARKLNITTPILQQSDLEIDPDSVEPRQWPLRIAEKLVPRSTSTHAAARTSTKKLISRPRVLTYDPQTDLERLFTTEETLCSRLVDHRCFDVEQRR